MLLLGQMVILFLLMVTGFVCKKRGIISDAGGRTLSGIVVYVANPAMVLTAGMNKEQTLTGAELARAAVVTVAVYVFLIIISFLIPLLLRADRKSRATYQVMTVFSNIGFMGFPLVAAVYGKDALLYASFFSIPYNILIYTWAIYALTLGNEDKKDSVEKRGGGYVLKKAFNIGVLSSILAVVLYLTGIRVPDFIDTTVDHLANLTAPLSMIVIGASVVNMDLKSLLKDVRLILFSLIKLIVIPLIGIPIIRLFGFDDTFLGVCLIMISTPVGAMTAMLAQEYEGNYELASKGVALTTLLSVVTIPLVSMILGV